MTAQEKAWVEQVPERMHAGGNFDTAFRAIYQRLLRGEGVTMGEMVTMLYHNEEDQNEH